MIWTAFLTVASAASASASAASSSAARFAKRQHDNPTVQGDSTNGWRELPSLSDQEMIPDFSVAGGQMPVYRSTGRDNNNIKRAVIILPGKDRDCWQYVNAVNNGLIQADGETDDINASEVSIMGPCFLTQPDFESGSALEGQFVWGATTWASGQQNSDVATGEAANVSSYDVIDGLVDHYMDRSTYPNLQAVVVGGHSLGAQMAQRYAALRKSTDNDDRLQFWIANSGSFVWLTADRPKPDANCQGVDVFKYGLDGGFPTYAAGNAKQLGRERLQQRYLSRAVMYAQGLADDGPGDTRCQALVQGANHLERGQNYEKMLQSMPNGIPLTQTFDYIQNVSHNNEAMIYSAQGKDKLFRYLRPACGDGNATCLTFNNSNNGKKGGSGSGGKSAATPATELGAILFRLNASVLAVFIGTQVLYWTL